MVPPWLDTADFNGASSTVGWGAGFAWEVAGEVAEEEFVFGMFFPWS
jgi:hypothetical protein